LLKMEAAIVALLVLPVLFMSQNAASIEVRDLQIVFNASSPNDADLSMDDLGRIDVAWIDVKDMVSELYYLKVHPDGYKLHDDMRIARPSGNVSYPNVCGTRDNTTTLSWVEGGTIYFSTLRYDGGDIDLIINRRTIVEGIDLTARPTMVRTHDGHALLLWSQAGNGSELRFAILDGEVTVRTLMTGLGPISSLDVTEYAPGEYAVVWNGQYRDPEGEDPNNGIFFARFSEEVEVLFHPVRKSIVSPLSRPDMAYAGGEFHIVFSTTRYSRSGVLYTRFNITGDDSMDDIPLTDHTLDCRDPSIEDLPDGEMSLAWWESREAERDLVCSILDPANIEAKPVERRTLSLNAVTLGRPAPQVISPEGDVHFIVVEPPPSGGIRLLSDIRPDLSITGISYGDLEPIVGENVTLSIGLAGPLEGATLEIKVTDPSGGISLHGLTPTTSVANLTLDPEEPGEYLISAMIDPLDEIRERSEFNNGMDMMLTVGVQDFTMMVQAPKNDVPPGAKGSMIAIISNDGTVLVDAMLAIIGETSDWFDINTTTVTVAPGRDSTIQLSFTPPLDALADDYLVVVSLSSQRMKADTFSAHDTIKVGRVHDLSVSFGTYKNMADPGSSQSIPISLQNSGNTKESFIIDAVPDPNIIFSVKGQALPYTTATVSPGSRLDLTLTYTLPINLTPDQVLRSTVSISNSDLSHSFSYELNVTVAQMPKASIGESDSDLILPGNWTSMEVPLLVKNDGNSRDIFSLELKPRSDGWIGEVIDPYEGTITLSPGEEATVILLLTPPVIPRSGVHEFVFDAEPQSRSDQSASRLLKVKVEDRHRVTFTQKELHLKTVEGEKHRITLSFTNTGNKDSTFSLTLSGDAATSTMIEPMTGGRYPWNETKPITLGSGASFTFYIEFVSPNVHGTSDLIINATCVEDTTVSDVMIVRLQLPPDDNLRTIMLISGIILVFAMGGVLFVVTKYLMKKRTTAKVDLLEEELDAAIS